MSLLDRPKTTNVLTVFVTGAVVIGAAAVIGQSLTLAVGLTSAALFTASGRLFRRDEFSYHWLLGQILTLVACVCLIGALVGVFVSATVQYSGVGIGLSIASALALLGGGALVMWDVSARTTSEAIDRIYRSLLVGSFVLVGMTAGAITLATQFGLTHVGAEPRLFRAAGTDRIIATELGASVIVLVAVTVALYAVRSLLTYPAVTELYTQLTYGLGDHPSQSSETLLTDTSAGAATRSPTDTASELSDDPDSSDKSDASHDDIQDSETVQVGELPSKVTRPVPFVHYTPSLQATLSAYVVVFLTLVCSLSLREGLRDPPSSLAGPESLVILRDSIAVVIGALGGSASLVRGTLGLVGVLLITHLVARLAWRFVQRGWRRYVSGLAWFVIPVLAGIGVSVVAASVLEILRRTPAVHYVPVVEDGIRIYVTEGGIDVRELDVGSIAVTVQYDSTAFIDGLELARELIGAPGLLLLPVSGIVLLAYLTLVVARVTAWKLVAFRADPALVGPLLIVVGVVLAAGIGPSVILALLLTAGAFLLVQLRSLTVQYDSQFPSGALTRRGELAYAVAPVVLIAVGVLVAGVGTLPSLHQMAAPLPEWRLLVGAAVTFGVVFLSLLLLSLTSE